MFAKEPVEAHKRHTRFLPDGSIILPAFPGSGAALIGNMLIQLGLKYFDPYTQTLDLDGSMETSAGHYEYRSRLSGYVNVDRDQNQRTGIIYCKTHLRPDEFSHIRIGAVLLLVRDPRDAIYSFYNWRVAFSGVEREDFSQFLRRPGLSGLTPPWEWLELNESWASLNRQSAPIMMVKFEDLKRDPSRALRRMLQFINVKVGDELIAQAVKSSTFESMRAYEDDVCRAGQDEGRVMRRGKVDEWREWYGTPELQEPFGERGFAKRALFFGYNL